jgi:hypothetical protein
VDTAHLAAREWHKGSVRWVKKLRTAYSCLSALTVPFDF